MFCTKCGAYNNDDAKNCTVCQSGLIEDTDNNAEQISEDSTELNSEILKNPPKTYFFASVISAVLGSIPFGAAAMVLSEITDVNIESGNIELAERYSKKTKLFCLISLFVGIVKYISILFWLMFYMVK